MERELNRRRAEFDTTHSAATPGASPAIAETTAVPTLPDLPPVQTPNAKWKSLHDQFADADVRLQRFLLTHTEEHPLVIEARRIVDGLRAELAATPKILSVVPESNPFVVARRRRRPRRQATRTANRCDRL